MEIPTQGLRVNVGNGGKRIDGWTGVDAVPRDGTDIVADAASIPLPDGCAVELMAIHLFEHFYPWQAPDLLAEWHRLLRPGGRLILEMPDVLKACKNIAEDYRRDKHPDQMGMWAIYGNDQLRDPLMMHKAGWWFERLRPIVEAAGFINVVECETVFHRAGRERRDFRLEAVKR